VVRNTEGGEGFPAFLALSGVQLYGLLRSSTTR
jgi:hypothetical protein